MSWKAQTEIPVIFVRYEDLKMNSFEHFKKILAFLALDFSEDKIRVAIKKSDFHTLKDIEITGGFKERLLESVPFFHSAESGKGAEAMTHSQKQKTIEQNEYAMKFYGYL